MLFLRHAGPRQRLEDDERRQEKVERGRSSRVGHEVGCSFLTCYAELRVVEKKL